LICSTGKKVFVVLLLTVLLLTTFSQGNSFAAVLADQMTTAISNRLKTGQAPKSAGSSGETLSFPAELKIFYARRGFHPAWISNKGLLPAATSLLDVLQKASRHGLQPEDYHLAPIKSLMPRRGILGSKIPLRFDNSVDLDFLLTDAFFLYASHLATGKVNPEQIKAQWFIRKRKLPDLPRTLEKALQSGNPESLLESLAPSSSSYTRLMAALQKYRKIDEKGGWPVVPAGTSLKEGDRSEQVLLLRERLEIPGVFPFWEDNGNNEGKYLFDESLVQAVKAFQQRHGLTADGVVGPETLEIMNIPVAERISQIEVNLERRRWMPDALGDPVVIINIPEFMLRFIKNGKEVINSRIVVGKYASNTPAFDSRISHFILNPYWNVPRSIAAEEILPQIQKSEEYLIWEDMKVLSDSKGTTKIVPPWTINWQRMTAGNFNYLIRQDPGPRNPLGRIKFVFPNSFDVYLHDTPARNLFEKTERSFSHGCIRVEHPIELAAFLMPGDPAKSENELQSAAEAGERKQIRLPRAVGIYILYFTAWVDADGTVQFRKDIYNHDAPLQDALRKAVALSGSWKD